MARKDFAALESRRTSGSSGPSAARDALRSRMGNPTSLRLDEVQANPRNPRYNEEDPEVQELASTLARVGQLQPALVVPREQYLQVFPDQQPAVGAQPWVVIVGNRRLAAARVANRPALDVRVAADLDSVEAFEDRVLIENLQRKDLPPLLEAEHLRRRLERPGETFRSVGEAIGKSHTYVQQRLELLKLIPELQALLRDGTLTIKAGRRLGALPEDQQRDRYAQGPPYLDRTSPDAAAAAAAGAGAGNPVATGPDSGTSDATPDADNGSGGPGDAVPTGHDNGGEAAVPGGRVNRVAKPTGSGRRVADGQNRSLEARLVEVLVHVDNALTELDAALPDGGAGAGEALTESQRYLSAARAALARHTAEPT